MPQYDFRCRDCRRRFSLHFGRLADYEAATPSCSACGSANLSRVITQVAIRGAQRDYSKMSSREMLSVLESGDQRQVESLFKQVGGDARDDPGPDKR